VADEWPAPECAAPEWAADEPPADPLAAPPALVLALAPAPAVEEPDELPPHAETAPARSKAAAAATAGLKRRCNFMRPVNLASRLRVCRRSCLQENKATFGSEEVFAGMVLCGMSSTC
jgi:hypothetical protein